MAIRVENWEDSGIAPRTAEWFKPYEPIFLHFAERHNLAIGQYLKDMPAWHLVFTHPRGGRCRIDMKKNFAASFSLAVVWTRDNYGAGARSLKWWVIDKDVPAEQLARELELTLETALGWKEKDFDSTHDGFAQYWHKVPKEEFEREQHKYPLPRTAT